MPKPLLGLLLGALLGLIDGATAYLYPYEDVRNAIIEVMIGSTVKGLLTGVIAGFVARKWQSLPLGIGVGVVVGGLLAYGVASMNGYYWEIIPPGMALGVIVGFATQKYGSAPVRS